MEVVASPSQGRTAAAQCGLFTCKSVPGGNMATLRKTEFFHLEIPGKVRNYHGCCLDHLSA